MSVIIIVVVVVVVVVVVTILVVIILELPPTGRSEDPECQGVRRQGSDDERQGVFFVCFLFNWFVVFVGTRNVKASGATAATMNCEGAHDGPTAVTAALLMEQEKT